MSSRTAVHRFPKHEWHEVHGAEERALGDQDQDNRAALCLSGGGIRSATFNLGVLQALACKGLLEKFDYLSTVSGGGYIGSWLSSRLRRAGRAAALKELRGEGPPTIAGNPESAAIRHLRRFSSYLNPRRGPLSVDTWTLGALYIRNLLLTWLILIPFLIAASLIPQLTAALTLASGAALLCILGALPIVAAFILITANQPSTRHAAIAPPTMERDLQSDEPLSFHVLLARFRQTPTPRNRVTFVFKFARFVLVELREGFRSGPASTRRVLFGITFILFALGAFLINAGGYTLVHDGASRFLTFGAPLLLGLATGLVTWISYNLLSGHWNRWRELGASIGMGLTIGAVLTGLLTLWNAFLPPLPWRLIWWTTLATPGILMALNAGATLYVGLISRAFFARDEDREWWGRISAWLLMIAGVWLTFHFLALIGPYAVGLLLAQTWSKVLGAGAGALAGFVTLILGKQDPRASSSDEEAGFFDRLKPWLKHKALKIAPAVFIAFLVVIFSALGGIAVDAMADGFGARDEVWGITLAVSLVIALLALFSVLMAFMIHSNKFSLHGIYRDRLIRSYLGASRPDRAPDWFTGFDPDDDLSMYQLRARAKLPDELTFDELDLMRRQFRTNPTLRRRIARMMSETALREIRRWLENQPDGPDKERISAALADQSGDPMKRAIAGLPADHPLRRRLEWLQWDARFPHRQATRRRRRGRSRAASAIKGALRSRVLLAPLTRWEREDVAWRFNQNCPLTSEKPLHIVNVTLNVVRGIDVALQDRKAESFTMSPFHCGCPRLGFRDSMEYGDRHGVTLGTAMAISGAAVSPSMGSYSSPTIAFILTLFNVRLGWWLANPGKPGDTVINRSAPKFGLWTAIVEALSLANDKRKFVYLSDGGHFDNLGLYEMVRRRCRRIIVCDAGADPKCVYSDLGNAVRRIRMDFGVSIELTTTLNFDLRHAAGTKPIYIAEGVIKYPNAKPGKLLYIKPGYFGGEPPDVMNYAKDCPDFPHESTADQFFSESQFESYRALGDHIIEHKLVRPHLTDLLNFAPRKRRQRSKSSRSSPRNSPPDP